MTYADSQKCDGARPKCGPCARSRVFEDCEYAEGGRTTGQRLEGLVMLLVSFTLANIL